MSGLDERGEAMRAAGVTVCPIWCAQPADEHNYEDHISGPATFTNADLVTIEVRVSASWFDPSAARLFVRPEVDDDGDFVLTAGDLETLASIGERLLDDVDRFWADARSDARWAYSGAENDANNKEE